MSDKEITTFLKAYQSGERPYLGLDDMLDVLDYILQCFEVNYPDACSEVSAELCEQISAYASTLYPFDSQLDERLCRLSMASSNFELVRQKLKQHEGEAEFKVIRAEYLLYMGKTDELEQYIIALEKEGLVEMEYLYERIVMLSLNMDYSQFAYECLKKATRMFPDNQLLKEDYALLLQEFGSSDEALNEFNHLVELDPFNAYYWSLKGKLHSIRSEYDAAIEAFDYALSCEDDQVEIVELQTLKMLCLYFNHNYLKTIEVAEELLDQNLLERSFISPYLLSCYIQVENFESAYAVLMQMEVPDSDKRSVLNFYLNGIYICIETNREEEAKQRLADLNEYMPELEDMADASNLFTADFFDIENDAKRYLFVMNKLISIDFEQLVFSKILSALSHLYPEENEFEQARHLLDLVSSFYMKLGDADWFADILTHYNTEEELMLEKLSEEVGMGVSESETIQWSLSDSLFSEKSNWN